MDLIQYLIKKNILKKDQSTRLRNESRKTGLSIEELILRERIINEEQLFKLKSEVFKVSLKKILVERISSEVLSVIPRESAEFYKMIPLILRREGKILEVGMVFPENPQAQEALKFLARQQKLTTKVFLITDRKSVV